MSGCGGRLAPACTTLPASRPWPCVQALPPTACKLNAPVPMDSCLPRPPHRFAPDAVDMGTSAGGARKRTGCC